MGRLRGLIAGLLAGLLLAAPAAALQEFAPGGIGKGQPSIVALNKIGIAMFVRGADDALWWKTGNGEGGEWSEWQSLGGILTSSPTCVSFKGGARCFGVGTDQAMWTILVGAGGAIGDWQSLGGTITNTPSSAVAAPNGDQQGVFAIGRGTDGGLFVRGLTFDNETELLGWSDWIGTGATAWASMGCTGILTREVNCYYRREDNSIREIAGALKTTPKVNKLDGLTDKPVAAFSNTASTTLKLAVRGMDGQLWLKTWKKGAGWDAWMQLPVTIANGPSCAWEFDGDIWCGAFEGDGSLRLVQLKPGDY